jgi:hypothetical protein
VRWIKGLALALALLATPAPAQEALAPDPELQAQCEAAVDLGTEIGLFLSLTPRDVFGVDVTVDDALFAGLLHDEKLAMTRMVACAFGLRQGRQIVEVTLRSAYSNKRLANWYLGLFTVD